MTKCDFFLFIQKLMSRDSLTVRKSSKAQFCCCACIRQKGEYNLQRRYCLAIAGDEITKNYVLIEKLEKCILSVFCKRLG